MNDEKELLNKILRILADTINQLESVAMELKQVESEESGAFKVFITGKNKPRDT